MQIQEFITSGQSFSRYDITKALRQKCNDGQLEIPEIENVNPGNIRFNVRKASVDTIFDQLYSNLLQNGIPALRYDFNRDQQTGVGYRVFSVDNTVAQTVLPVVAAPAPAPTPSPATSINSMNYFAVQASASTSPDDAEIRRRATVYLQNCQKIGKVPSLKKIQSAIKRKVSTGLSRKECFNLATSLGFKV